ncbi:MAG: hypothetical protein FWG68_06660 [Defluviitaleaceae bacterium]|nr:hypothetical protein [Defluviitaleaceae bacterium]
MQERISGFFQAGKDRWTALEKQQKTLFIAVVAIILVALAITVFLTTRTVYSVAMNNLTEIETMQLSTLLEENGIRHRIQQGGTVLEVEQPRLNDARVLIATQGLMVDREFTYQDALDFSGIGATETITRANLMRARQADLERAIASLNSVLWAQVELILPDPNRFFLQSTEPASAGVIVGTTRRLTSTEGEGIARFVQASVLGLALENITVMDTDFNMIFIYTDLTDPEDAMLSQLLDIMVRERIQIAEQVRNLFRPMYSSVEVVPNLVYSQTRTTAESVTFNLPDGMEDGGIVLTESTLNASARGTQTAFEPGTQPNAAFVPNYLFGGAGDMNASQQTAERVFAVNELREIVQEVPSTFLRNESSLGITLVRHVDHRQVDLGLNDSEWNDFQNNTHHQLLFAEGDPQLMSYVQTAQAATGVQHVAITVWEVPNFIDAPPPAPLPIGSIVMFAILAILIGLLALGMINRNRQEMAAEEELEPELSVEGLLASTQMEEEMAAEEVESIMPIGYEESSEAKQKLDAFIDDKPEAAANLLRHWLNEAEV